MSKWTWFRLSLGSVFLGVFCGYGLARADEQVWDNAGPNNLWSLSDLNWDAGVGWTDGNSALFTGGGETVDVSGAVSVSNITFQANGYEVADADTDGTLTLVGVPSVIAVQNAGHTGVITEVIAGSGGFAKAGSGVLQLKAANTYSGVTTVSAGILRLNPSTLAVLGATGAGNETVVEDGATLDVNSAWNSNVNEDLVISGSGVNGVGALINAGPTPYYNVGYHNLTLAGDATIGVYQRFDMSSSGTFTGNGHTLTKIGNAELAVSRAVNGVPIVINAGIYTIQYASALGSTDYPTTLNGGKLQAWGSYTLAEPLTVNGGTISSGGTGTQTFKLTGNMTLNSNLVVQTDVSVTNTLELAGVMDGAGGLTRTGNGFVKITGDANTFSGPTIVNGGSRLWVGATVEGPGRLGSGAVTNNGTLYANSPVLGTGEVVNNSGGTLYLNPSLLDSGWLVNKGTVYGTSVLQTANGVVNSGTWNSYSGAFGSGILTNANGGTLNLYTNVLTYGQFVNGGKLSVWQPMTLSDPITFNGGSVYVGDTAGTLSMPGTITTVSLAVFDGTNGTVTEVGGTIKGPGGIVRSGDGWCFITGEANDYTGPTTVNGGRWLFVGKPAGEAGGVLGSGVITNNGTLYFDSEGAYTNPNGLNGSGVTAVRYGGALTLSGGVSTNNAVHVAHGSLSLTNGAQFCLLGDLTVANRQNVNYVVAPTNCPLVTNVVATVNVSDGSLLRVKSVTFGNGPDLSGGTMTGVLNQVGGTVITTGNTAEENGIRLGHYPQTRSFYNMMGGTLIVGADYDLGCATDGQGWFNMSGGDVFAKRVMLNERHDTGGYGRLTVSGGVMNLGSLTGSSLAVSNGICADRTAPYLVSFGGAGGTIRAVTNLDISVSATLVGTGADAITLDTQEWEISMTNKLSGTGGLNKAGSGTLTLAGANTYAGATRVMAGTLVPASAGALPAGGEVLFDVSADDSGGRLASTGDLSLEGVVVGVANPETLDTGKSYTIATYGGTLIARAQGDVLPEPWYVYYDWAGKRVLLKAAIGTVLRVK